MQIGLTLRHAMFGNDPSGTAVFPRVFQELIHVEDGLLTIDLLLSLSGRLR